MHSYLQSILKIANAKVDAQHLVMQLISLKYNTQCSHCKFLKKKKNWPAACTTYLQSRGAGDHVNRAIAVWGWGVR